MRRASSRFILPASLSAPLLVLAPAVAGHADDAAAPAADPTGMTITVKNCNDSGLGSLRAAVASALSGDTIDMRGLGCRRINLTSGAIMIAQDDLTLLGGGITVDANGTSSVFRHSGIGWLRIRGMTIARGFHRPASWRQPQGGCLYSAGSIDLTYSTVHWCVLRGVSGGGVYASGAVTLTNSQVLGNTASYYGGIATGGRLTAYRSRICGNHSLYSAVLAGGGLKAYGSTFSANDAGALFAIGDTIIMNSTISGNRSRVETLGVISGSGNHTTLISNSTVSDNRSGYRTLGLGTDTTIINSTIAFNQHASEYPTTHCSEATVPLDNLGIHTLHMESTIVANNSCAGTPYLDVGKFPPSQAVLKGADNLITLSNMPLPPDTISTDPRLAPLADNGGRTKTHALLDDSPAIDMGNNAAGLAYDQRGPGFPRVKGPQADIGAYER